MPVEQRHVKSIAKSGDSELKGNITLSGGTNITLTQAGQDIEIAAGAAGAPTDAQYVTLAVDGDLSAERVLAGGTGIDIADGGANNNVTLSLDVSELGAEATIAAGDFIVMEDITDNGSQKITFANLEGTIDHGNLAGLDTGADHSYIDQDVTSGASPTFDGTNFTGIPDGALSTDYVEVAGDTMTGNLVLDDNVTNSPWIDFIDVDEDKLRIYKDDDNSCATFSCDHEFQFLGNGITGYHLKVLNASAPNYVGIQSSGTTELRIESGSGTVNFNDDTIETDGAITVNSTEIVGTDAEVNKTVIEGAPTGDFVGTTDTQTLTNKTLTSPTINMGDGMPSTNVRCRAYLNTNVLNLTDATAYLVEFANESYDSGGDFNTTTHLFTAPVTGYYSVSASVRLATASVVAGDYSMYLYRNGSTVVTYVECTKEAGEESVFTLSDILHLSSTDTLGLYFRPDVGASTVDIAGDFYATFMAIHLLSV